MNPDFNDEFKQFSSMRRMSLLKYEYVGLCYMQLGVPKQSFLFSAKKETAPELVKKKKNINW